MYVETKSSFLNHFLLWVLTATAFSLIFLPYLMPADSFSVSKEEIEFFNDLGRDTKAVTKSANSIYSAIFDGTGAGVAIDNIFHKTDRAEVTRSGIVVAVDWARKWMDNFTRMIFRGIWRLIALWPIYLAGMLTFCIPAFVDGLVARAKKKYDFLQSNPVFFYGASHFVAFAFGASIFVPIAPLPLSGVLIAALIAFVALAMRVAAANFQTGQ